MGNRPASTNIIIPEHWKTPAVSVTAAVAPNAPGGRAGLADSLYATSTTTPAAAAAVSRLATPAIPVVSPGYAVVWEYQDPDAQPVLKLMLLE